MVETKVGQILSSFQWCLFETSRIMFVEVKRDFVSLCIEIGGFCITTSLQYCFKKRA